MTASLWRGHCSVSRAPPVGWPAHALLVQGKGDEIDEHHLAARPIGLVLAHNRSNSDAQPTFCSRLLLELPGERARDALRHVRGAALTVVSLCRERSTRPSPADAQQRAVD